MALRCSPSPCITAQKPCSVNISASRVLMLAQCHSSVKSTHQLQIRSSLKNKVFEDQAAGIVCYRDDHGEITCEGYDEGPRLDKELTRLPCNSRDAEIVELLQRSWLLFADSELADNDAVEAKDFNWNGFNTFC
ncbi:hypothetical protein RJ639_043921 [Escallonia herrerae]|uniref:Uncharacterized protein n=1 Tax=Escallonia herrerae TaxID=1293975 RepID=A0AA89B185_9ASTE|nr:hypothetical protein RJ639_043921 [Escallonia herrerae]